MKKLITAAFLAVLSMGAIAQSALTITGMVTDSSGAPAVGKTVAALDSTGQFPVFGLGVTDLNGLYSIQAIGNSSGLLIVGTNDCDGTILYQAFPYSGSDSISANFALSCNSSGNPGGGNGPGNGGGNPGSGNGPWGSGYYPSGGICSPCNPLFFPHTDSSLTAGFHLLSMDSSLTYTWNFGDGSIGTGINPQHTYAVAGSYIACVAVSGMLPDSTLCSDTVCRLVVVPFTPQLGGCNGGGNHPWGGGNYPGGGNGPWGGGNPGGGNGPWGGGNGPQPCFAGFIAVPDTAPMSYFFLTLPGDTNNIYTWDFGDGSTGSSPLENYMYTNPGTYVVCLTVSNALDSCTSTYCDTLTVSSATWTNINSFTVGTAENSWSTELNVYPVPFDNTLQLEFELAEAGPVQISLMDAKGRVVSFKRTDASKGVQRVTLHTEEMSNGVYFVMMHSNTFTTMRRVVK